MSGTEQDHLADRLDAANDIIEETVRGIVAELGGPSPSRLREYDLGAEAFARRMEHSPRLKQAVIDQKVCTTMIAVELIKGYEPVPGTPGRVRLRAGGPLPLAQQRLRLAVERCITVEELEEIRLQAEAGEEG